MSWFNNLFGGGSDNPADKAMPYLDKIPGATNPYHQPFFNAGTAALPGLQEQYGKLLSDPGGFSNNIGAGYKESPGFKFALQQALEAGNHASAAGGMAGTPAHQYQAMQDATGLANQDYNHWFDRTIGLYGAGLSGQQGLAGMGQQAGNSMADMIAQTLAQQGNLAFRGQEEENSQNNSFLGGLGKIFGASLGAFNPFSNVGKLAGPMTGSAFLPWKSPD